MKKIIFYTLHDSEKSKGAQHLSVVTYRCPVEWYQNKLWASDVEGQTRYTCSITYIVHGDR